MKSIRKLQVPSGTGEITHRLAKPHKIIHLGEHMGDLFIWVEEPKNIAETVEVRFIGLEGDELLCNHHEHLDTVVMKGTQRVVHIYMEQMD